MKKRYLIPLLLISGLGVTGCKLTALKPTADATGGAALQEVVVNGVHEYRLDNGMKILVKEDHRAPIAVSQVWYKVGSSYEHNGITGVSHVLEHMMFKGTEKYPPGEFSRIIAANGGSENAFTGQDYTAYFQTLEKSRLPIAFELEADRMRNLQLQQAEFAKEVQVVMEERRMRTEDNPNSLLYERFSAAAYVTSPYHNPVIGWMNDLESLKVEDLARWYQMWYAPNNATLVVVGDVEPREIYALAKQHFGPLQPSVTAELKPQQEIAPKGQRRITVQAPSELPYMIMGYQVPSLKTAPQDWEPYALDVLASILDGGNSARFARELVRGSQVAASAGAGYDLTARLSTQFLFDGTPANGHSIADLEQTIQAQIQRLKDEPVSQEELDRIKAQVVTGKVYELDSVFYQAMQLGMLDTVGLDWRLLDEYVTRIQAVTAAQIQEVAQKYLVDNNLTVAVLDPLPLDPNAVHQPTMGGRHAR